MGKRDCSIKRPHGPSRLPKASGCRKHSYVWVWRPAGCWTQDETGVRRRIGSGLALVP